MDEIETTVETASVEELRLLSAPASLTMRDYPDGRDWHCEGCGRAQPDETVYECCPHCSGELMRVSLG